MTLVLGLKYDEGSIIASDSLALGYDARRDVEVADKYVKKVFLLKGKCGVTFSGYLKFGSKIKETLEESEGMPDKEDLEKAVLGEYAALKEKFAPVVKSDIEAKQVDELFSSVVIIGNAEHILAVTEKGKVQECRYFCCAGVGSALVEDYLKEYYANRQELPSEREALELCISSIDRASKSPFVGEVPEIIILRKNGKVVDLSDRILERYKTLMETAKSEICAEVLSCSSKQN